MSNITIKYGGSFWFVLSDGEPLGHAYKVAGFEGESGWKSAFRMIFRPLWRASAGPGDEITHLEELYGSVFRSRSEAIGAAADSEGVASSHCSWARGTASTFLGHLHIAAMQGGQRPALTAALAELNAFLARAC